MSELTAGIVTSMMLPERDCVTLPTFVHSGSTTEACISTPEGVTTTLMSRTSASDAVCLGVVGEEAVELQPAAAKRAARAPAAATWVAWSAFAVPAGILTGGACVSLLPRMWQGPVPLFAVFPAVIGVTIGALTVRPLMTLLRDEGWWPSKST